LKFWFNAHPTINNSIQLHQAEAVGFLEVLVNIVVPHEVHIVWVLLGPSGVASVFDGTPKHSQRKQRLI